MTAAFAAQTGPGHALLEAARQHWVDGDRQHAELDYLRAWEWAVEHDDALMAAHVALGPELRLEFHGRGIVDRVHRCRWVLERLPDGPSELRVRLLATLAVAQLGLDTGASQDTAALAAASAAAVESVPAKLYALVAEGLTDVAAERVDTRLGAARRILADAHAHDVPEIAEAAYFLLLSSCLEKGDITTLDTELGWRSESIGQFPVLEHSRTNQWFGCLRTILDGQTDAAQAQADALRRRGERLGDPDALSVWIAHTGIIQWMRGSIIDAELLFLSARKHQPDEVVWSASLAWLWFLQGRATAAQGLLDELPAIEDVVCNRNWAATAVVYAELAMLTDDHDAMVELHAALLPYQEHVVPIGVGVAFWGTAARTLGRLSERLGHVDQARASLRLAIDICVRTGAHAWLAEAQVELAEFELRHDPRSSVAGRLLEEALSTGQSLRLSSIVARAEQALTLLTLEDEFAEETAPQINVMGVFEVVTVTGEPVRWTSRKSREMLKMLVSRRGRAVPRETIMDQLWPGEDPQALANRFAVALSTVRRALNPDRDKPVQYYVELEDDALRLRTDRLDVDVEAFLALAPATDPAGMRSAVALHRGEVFAEEPDAPWAVALRNEAQFAFCALALRLADHEHESGAGEAACVLYQRVLDIDPHNEMAHRGLVDALTAMGAHGQARHAARQHAALTAEVEPPHVMSTR